MLKKQNSEVVRNFTQALKAGSLALHPTDTIPGLTCLPKDETLKTLSDFKKRSPEKSFIGLVGDFATACKYWRPLPSPWSQVLQKLWPGPLSVVWKATERSLLANPQGELALRHPNLSPTNAWYLDVLRDIGQPLPTTSVNKSHEDPCRIWDQAVSFAKFGNIYVPNVEVNLCPTQPSTLIKIINSKRFIVLRQGAVGRDQIEETLNSLL